MALMASCCAAAALSKLARLAVHEAEFVPRAILRFPVPFVVGGLEYADFAVVDGAVHG